MKEGDVLFLNRSRSGRGIYISHPDLGWMLIGNLQHLRDFVDGKKHFVLLTVRKKNVGGTQNE